MSGIDLDGACVVITGASSGIGQATAEAFARAGSRLVLCARGAAALQRVARRCRELGGEAIVVPADVTDAGAVSEVVKTALAYGGAIDVWVSNVGVGAVGRFQETPAEAHQQVIRANLIGHMNDAHAVMPVFLDGDADAVAFCPGAARRNQQRQSLQVAGGRGRHRWRPALATAAQLRRRGGRCRAWGGSRPSCSLL
jgi:NADP-dependent 3-hydroxy acid dehydrogenase YdfG